MMLDFCENNIKRELQLFNYQLWNLRLADLQPTDVRRDVNVFESYRGNIENDWDCERWPFKDDLSLGEGSHDCIDRLSVSDILGFPALVIEDCYLESAKGQIYG